MIENDAAKHDEEPSLSGVPSWGGVPSWVELNELRLALYRDLDLLQTVKAEIEATEARAVATLRHFEADEWLKQHVEFGPDRELTADDFRAADEHARATVGAELAIITKSAPRTAEANVEAARKLVEEFPATFAALAEGQITPQLAKVVREVGSSITDPDRRDEYEQCALTVARSESITPSRLRPRARQLAENAEGSTQHERHARAADRRGIGLFDKDDGMSELIAYLPSVQAAGIYDRISTIARRLKDPDDPRTYDALRADVLSALLLTSELPISVATGDASRHGGNASKPGTTTSQTGKNTQTDKNTQTGDDTSPGKDASPAGGSAADPTENVGDAPIGGWTAPLFDDETTGEGGAQVAPQDDTPIGNASVLVPGQVKAQVMIVVPMLSLLGLSDEPATLNGMTPIPLADAAVLAANTPTWTRVLTNPVNGMPMAVDRYRPTAGQRAFLASRDRHCRYPGCRMPVADCDTDHTFDWALHGRTEIPNLSYLCERHHARKHTPAWMVTQGELGVLEWTTPTGRRVTDVPEPVGPAFTKLRVETLKNRARDILDERSRPPIDLSVYPWFQG